MAEEMAHKQTYRHFWFYSRMNKKNGKKAKAVLFILAFRTEKLVLSTIMQVKRQQT